MRKLKRPKSNDLYRSLTTLDMHDTLIVVVEMRLSSWLVTCLVPGVERKPLKKLKTDEHTLLALLHRWRAEAEKAGHDIDAHVIHAPVAPLPTPQRVSAGEACVASASPLSHLAFAARSP
jgi:hypothetical protein